MNQDQYKQIYIIKLYYNLIIKNEIFEFLSIILFLKYLLRFNSIINSISYKILINNGKNFLKYLKQIFIKI